MQVCQHILTLARGGEEGRRGEWGGGGLPTQWERRVHSLGPRLKAC